MSAGISRSTTVFHLFVTTAVQWFTSHPSHSPPILLLILLKFIGVRNVFKSSITSILIVANAKAITILCKRSCCSCPTLICRSCFRRLLSNIAYAIQENDHTHRPTKSSLVKYPAPGNTSDNSPNHVIFDLMYGVSCRSSNILTKSPLPLMVLDGYPSRA